MIVDFGKMQSDIESLNKKVDNLIVDLQLLIGNDGYMPLPKAADYLGISESTLRRYTKEIKHFQRDRMILFKKSDLDTWIARFEIK